MVRRLLPVLLVVPLLAGCIGLTGSSVDDGLEDPADEVQDAVTSLIDSMASDHDHTDPTIHNASYGVEEVGYSKLVGEEGKPASYTEIHKWKDYVVMETKLPTAGFVIADVSDPANPEVVSFTKSGRKYAPDAKWSPDGNWIFTAAHFSSYNPGNAESIQDHEGPAPLGVNVWDVSDKSNPKHASYMQCGTSGVHNVNVAEIGGTIWVFGACYDSFVDRVVIGRLHEETGQLVRVGEFSLGNFVVRAAAGDQGSVHDMVVNEDPVTDKPVLTVSYGSQGVVWVDVSDPMAPKKLGQWTWEGSDHVQGDHARFLHYAELAEETVQGQRITVAAPEYHSHPHTGQAWIVNTTDYSNPRLIGAWDGVGNVSYKAEEGDPASVYRYSPHNLRIRDGTFYIAHNHAGVWAVDFGSSMERLHEPKALGFFAETRDPGHKVPIDNAPDFWGLDLGEDHVYASDRGTGLYVLDLDKHSGHDHSH